MDSVETILSKFEEHQQFSLLGVRRFTFYKIIEHLAKAPSGLIIETGTAWDKDNWEGQGQSTLIWDWACQEIGHTAISIDLNPQAAEISMSQTKNIQFLTGDSVQTLNVFPDDEINKCRLLYLDSFDWSEEANLESSFHHMAELATVWKFLPKGCMVVVDDRHGDMKGKHWMVEAFMRKLGFKPAFKEYQIGWVL